MNSPFCSRLFLLTKSKLLYHKSPSFAICLPLFPSLRRAEIARPVRAAP
ncbi:hypothetical protein HMPREF0262_03576 [Clostridium sp. ATCC 29733]|nr:hypothetical protein HMPREF0262_03576 [Clostridium sp. ATCC 29733]